MSETPIMVGQTYARQSGPALLCEVRRVNAPKEGWAQCAMRDAARSYGVKPVPLDLLHSDEFELVP